VQAAEIGWFGRVHGVTLRDKVCSCEIRKTLNIEPQFLRLEGSQLHCFCHGSRMFQEGLGEKSCRLQPRESILEVIYCASLVNTCEHHKNVMGQCYKLPCDGTEKVILWTNLEIYKRSIIFRQHEEIERGSPLKGGGGTPFPAFPQLHHCSAAIAPFNWSGS